MTPEKLNIPPVNIELTIHEKILILVIDGKNKGHRQVADIFNAKQSVRNIYQPGFSSLIVKLILLENYINLRKILKI